MKFWICAASLACGLTAVCAADPVLSLAPSGSTDTVSTTLSNFRTLGKTNPGVAAALAERQQRLAIVFVPGILGSKLVAADGSVIFGDLSSPTTLISRLELPPELIDENKESGVRAELLSSLAGVDLYGNAMGPMQQWAANQGVQFVTCGYDWRRDIRWGSKDLDRCIQAQLGAQPRDIVLVAHSMGGLVTWNWMMEHDRGRYSPQINVLAVTLLGSPLQGSCEIIRMIQSGYIQPERNSMAVANGSLRPVASGIEKWVDALKNMLSGTLTQGIRPLVLTWPGAIELSPAPVRAYGKTSCVGIPAASSQPVGSPSTSYYDTAFWKSVAGQDMLLKGSDAGSYEVPASLDAVLSKAAEFRGTFHAGRLSSPAWVYLSNLWFVPMAAGYVDPHITGPNQWTTVWGDGRVPGESAVAADDPTVFSYVLGIPSVHGNLPADPNFFDDFFGSRLPRLLRAAMVAGLMEDAGSHPDWLAGYAKLSNIAPEPAEVRPSLEPSPAVGSQDSSVLKKALAAGDMFKANICDIRHDCAVTYIAAKRSAAIAGTPLAKISQFGFAARALGPDHANYPYAEGGKGLEYAKTLNWSAAAVSLGNASKAINTAVAASAAPVASDAAYKKTLDANLAKSLYAAGQCKKAEPYLRASADYWSFSRNALSKPCNDAPSGLQYCFDTGNFCRPGS